MNKLMTEMKAFLKDEEGLTAVEYAIAGGLVSAALVAGFGVLGDQACALMDDLVTAIDTGSGGAAPATGWAGC